MVNIGGGFRFIGTMLSYILFGSFFTFFVLFLCLCILLSEGFWKDIVWEHIDFWIGYILYFVLDACVIAPITMVYITDGDWVRPGMEPYFKFFAVTIEMFYLPLSALYALLSIVYEIIWMWIAFIRPDTVIFPRGLEWIQSGHYVFICNVKMIVNRIKQQHEGYPLSAEDEIEEAQENLKDLNDQREVCIQERDWFKCMSIDKDIERVEKRIEVLEINPQVGERVDMDYNGEVHLIEICKVIDHKVKIKYVDFPFCQGIGFCNHDMVDILDERIRWKNRKPASSDANPSNDDMADSGITVANDAEAL